MTRPSLRRSNCLHVVGVKAFLRALPAKAAPNRDIILRELGAHPLVSREDLVDALYGQDPEGGPDSAGHAVHMEIWLLRKRGYAIVNYPTRGWSLAP